MTSPGTAGRLYDDLVLTGVKLIMKVILKFSSRLGHNCLTYREDKSEVQLRGNARYSRLTSYDITARAGMFFAGPVGRTITVTYHRKSGRLKPIKVKLVSLNLRLFVFQTAVFGYFMPEVNYPTENIGGMSFVRCQMNGKCIPQVCESPLQQLRQTGPPV